MRRAGVGTALSPAGAGGVQGSPPRSQRPGARMPALCLWGVRRGASEDSGRPPGTSAAAVPHLPDSDGRGHGQAGEAGGRPGSRPRGETAGLPEEGTVPAIPVLDGPEEAGAAPRLPPWGRLLPWWLVSPATLGLSAFSVLFKICIFSLPFAVCTMKESLPMD